MQLVAEVIGLCASRELEIPAVGREMAPRPKEIPLWPMGTVVSLSEGEMTPDSAAEVRMPVGWP